MTRDFSVAGADMALCVLSLPELLQRSHDIRGVEIPKDISEMISPQNTLVLLNKSDLLSSQQVVQADDVANRLKETLGIEKVWPVSISTQAGFPTFIQEFGDLLKDR